jgi:hypothetical protein
MSKLRGIGGSYARNVFITSKSILCCVIDTLTGAGWPSFWPCNCKYYRSHNNRLRNDLVQTRGIGGSYVRGDLTTLKSTLYCIIDALIGTCWISFWLCNCKSKQLYRNRLMRILAQLWIISDSYACGDFSKSKSILCCGIVALTRAGWPSY